MAFDDTTEPCEVCDNEIDPIGMLHADMIIDGNNYTENKERVKEMEKIQVK